MRTLSKRRFEEILRTGLRLKDPTFRLERAGVKLLGSVVSPTFRRKDDLKRQQMIWDTLDAALGAESVKLVSMILAYTPEEWDFGNADADVPAKAKAR